MNYKASAPLNATRTQEILGALDKKITEYGIAIANGVVFDLYDKGTLESYKEAYDLLTDKKSEINSKLADFNLEVSKAAGIMKNLEKIF